MSKKFMAVVGLAMAFSALSAFAGDQKDGDGKGGPAKIAREVTLEEFKYRCENWEKTDVQRPPQSIRVQCTDNQLEWVAGAPGAVPLQGTRRVGTALLSDKFVVSGIQAKDVPVFAQSGKCLRFKEIQKDLTIERALSCGEILNMKQGLEEYCVGALDQEKGRNPKLIGVQETGRVIDSCAGIASDGKGDGKKY